MAVAVTDLEIGVTAAVRWVQAALALSTLVTPVADNQRQGARSLSDAGAALLVDLQQAAELCWVPMSALPRPRAWVGL